MRILICLGITIFCWNNLCCQPSYKLVSSTIEDVREIEFNTSLPKFDLHIAAGMVSGGRLGIRYLFLDNFSAEIAYGADIQNFIGLSDPKTKYTAGLNYHFYNSIAVISLLATYVEQPTLDSDAILISPNFGLIQIRKSGFQFFVRAGVNIELQKDNDLNKWKAEDYGGNIDVGLAFDF